MIVNNNKFYVFLLLFIGSSCLQAMDKKTHHKKEIIFGNASRCTITLSGRGFKRVVSPEGSLELTKSPDIILKLFNQDLYVGSLKKPGTYCALSSSKKLGDDHDNEQLPLRIMRKNRKGEWVPVACIYQHNDQLSLERESTYFVQRKKRLKEYAKILNKQ